MDNNKLEPFKFWAQKVLPLVYDDSVSYYEVLCKVVEYINQTLDNVDTLHTDVTGLHEAYVQLQGYVNTYFDSLDVQAEINNKLDNMVIDGTLSGLIDPRIPNAVSAWLNENVDPVGSAVIVDPTLTISGAAADAKVTGDNFTNLKADLIKSISVTLSNGHINNTGAVKSNTGGYYKISQEIDVTFADKIRIENYYYGPSISTVTILDAYGNVLSFLLNPASGQKYVELTVPDAGAKAYVQGTSSKTPVVSLHPSYEKTSDLISDKADSLFVNSAMNLIYSDGTRRLQPDLFEYGWLSNGNIAKYSSSVELKSRVVTSAIQIAPYDMTIVPLSGYSIGVALYDDSDVWQEGGNSKSANPVYLVAGQHFRFSIIKTTEDTSEVANIPAYVNNVSITSIIAETNVTANRNKKRLDGLVKNYISQNETVSTLMSRRYGVIIAIPGLTLIKGRTYTVSLTPATAIDLESSSNSISPIIYKSDDTVGIRLGGVNTVDNVFNSKWTKSFEPDETLVDCKLGAYVVLPAVADHKILFEIADTTEDVLVKLKSGSATFPDYYDDYLADRLETIWDKDVTVANHGDSFIFITDVHETNSFNSPSLAKYIMDRSAVGRLMYGGDYINQPSSKDLAVETLQKSIAKLRVSERAVFLEGNHETNPYGTGQLTPGEVYGIINKRIERYVDTDAKNYYYFDNVSQKIRYIMLDTGETGDIDATQEAWVGATASSLESGWIIIILSHMAVYTSGKDERENVLKYDVVDKVLGAVSGISAKVACWVCGHTHKDFSYATTNFPIISVTCDANGNQASTYTSDNRDIGTTNEQAFDVFHVDTYSKTVYATRIGGGQYNVIVTGDLTDNDRQWSYT